MKKFLPPREVKYLPPFPLASTFGCFEYELLAKAIIDFIQSDETCSHWVLKHMADKGVMRDGGYSVGEGWEKRFTMDDILNRMKDKQYGSPTLFAMFGTSGWLQNGWFPKGTFMVSEGFVERLEEKGLLKKHENDAKSK